MPGTGDAAEPPAAHGAGSAVGRKGHLSARDIFEKLNDQGRNIGHTSVYQNLEALQSAGVIECLDRAKGRLYGYRSDPHSHLTCTESGEILDLDVLLPMSCSARSSSTPASRSSPTPCIFPVAARLRPVQSIRFVTVKAPHLESRQ